MTQETGRGNGSPTASWWLGIVLTVLMGIGGFILKSTIEKQDNENETDKRQGSEIATLQAQRDADHETLTRIEIKIDRILSTETRR